MYTHRVAIPLSISRDQHSQYAMPSIEPSMLAMPKELSMNARKSVAKIRGWKRSGVNWTTGTPKITSSATYAVTASTAKS
jgi:hypothetical protein